MIVEEEDMSGLYDYIPDIQSMSLPDDSALISAKKDMLAMAMNPQNQQALMQEGYKIKLKELEEDLFEQVGMKDADKYFEKISNQPMQGGGLNGQAQQVGGVGAPSGQMGQGNVGNPGMAESIAPVVNSQAGPVLSGPQQMQNRGGV